MRSPLLSKVGHPQRWSGETGLVEDHEKITKYASRLTFPTEMLPPGVLPERSP